MAWLRRPRPHRDERPGAAEMRPIGYARALAWSQHHRPPPVLPLSVIVVPSPATRPEPRHRPVLRGIADFGPVCQHDQVNPANVSYQSDLATVHHRGFGAHAAACAPGIVDFLAPVRTRRGLVLELGCGTGLLTRELVAAGYRVIATDAAPAMLDIARDVVGESVEEVRQLTLPDDPLPQADAIVAVGHPLSYLPDAEAIDRALIAMAAALRPDGLLAFDICDLEWGRARFDAPHWARSDPDWAIITEYSLPTPDRFVRDITTFLPNPDGSWRRGTEHHENVLIDTARIPALLGAHGVQAKVGASFGSETNPPGLRVVTGHKTP